jgi:3',5'-cyclic AMP phosphodiesterase CpdA
MKVIVHLSDLHFGTEKPELAEALRAELAEHPATLLVVSGDLTQRARTSQFVAAAAYLRRLPGPQLVVPGNHDVPLFDVARRFLAPLTRYRRHIGPDLDPVFDDGELCVAGLNTARSLTWQSGRISLEQIEALRRRLGGTSARYKVVMTHHPFIPPPPAPGGLPQTGVDLVGRAARAIAVLETCKVDLLLAGHLHHGYSGDVRTQYPGTRRAIISAQAGTAISGRVRTDPNGYNRITFSGERMTIEVRTWRGKAFSLLRTVEYARGPEGWMVQTKPEIKPEG